MKMQEIFLNLLAVLFLCRVRVGRTVPRLLTHAAQGSVHKIAQPISKLLLASPDTLAAFPKIKGKIFNTIEG